ncbi:hypothetical protein B0H19DRAFT_593639 [Mycena capillaripes]|nr:hypothetical protein B0H19DRAFT_593639 [Mycena capillaripes]
MATLISLQVRPPFALILLKLRFIPHFSPSHGLETLPPLRCHHLQSDPINALALVNAADFKFSAHTSWPQSDSQPLPYWNCIRPPTVNSGAQIMRREMPILLRRRCLVLRHDRQPNRVQRPRLVPEHLRSVRLPVKGTG